MSWSVLPCAVCAICFNLYSVPTSYTPENLLGTWLSSNAALAFLPAVPMGLRASSTAQMARLGRAPLALRMQQATVDREQDVGIGQADMRKDAESLMQPCPETK